MIINLKHYRTLQEAELEAANNFPENLEKFREIKRKILTNGYKANYDCYRARSEYTA